MPGSRWWPLWRVVRCCTLLTAFGLAPPAAAQTCGACASEGGASQVAAAFCPETGSFDGAGGSCGGFQSCRTATLEGPTLETFPEPDGEFTVRLRVRVKAPKNRTAGSAFWPTIFWFRGATAGTMSGNACTFGMHDIGSTYVEVRNVTCAGGDFGTFSLAVSTCQGLFPGCAPPAKMEGMQFAVAPGSLPGCPKPPPVSGCPDDLSCSLCQGPGNGSSPAGGGPGVAPAGSGPGAQLRYTAAGTGSAGHPGSAAWAATLGRGWSHDHAEKIVPDPDARHVWLLTRFGTFREFTDAAGDGTYETVAPSDERRKLAKTAAGWELRELGGTVHHFDAAGLWTRTADRNGNAVQGTYTSGRLSSITFPDGRGETFTYHPSGKLASITEIGVGGSPTRTWAYLWSGDDLTAIGRPDGTAHEFFYSDARFPGFLTRHDLVGTDLTRRIEAAWEYDAAGNVAKTWRGDPVFNGPNAVDVYSFVYTGPALPTGAAVTDPLGKVTTYTIARDSGSRKPKVTQISGDCPSCGTGPNTSLSYTDSGNPLLPTRQIDGRGFETHFAYDANGQMTSRTEAAGTSLARTTTWQYGVAVFPALPTRIEMPSTSGGGALRVSVLSYNAAGDLETRTEQGAEGGGSFTLSAATTYNAAGQPATVDPPGYGTADQMASVYDPARGHLLPLTRTDPLVGTTTLGHDGFNRRVSVIDPNGVETVTAYDSLDRITSVTQKGTAPASDLVTIHQYNAFGDLFRTTLPLGNLIEYGYDPAGRLVSIERKPDATTLGERTVYTLNAFGQRTKEQHQRWSGSAWVTESFTDSVYSSRCQLDKVIHADGTVTEYAYDCNGNLEKVWDARHPKATNPTPTQAHGYDALNRLTSTTQPWTGAGGGTAVTAYAYDVQDHLTTVTDAEGNTTAYTYSDRDLMTAEVSPVSGTAVHVYNDHGEKVSETDARGITINRIVDALDRVTAVTYPSPDLNVSYTYDDPAVPFSKGRLTRIARDSTSIDYRYDRFGRILQDGELTYAYDANSNPVSLVYPGGVEAVTTFDFADRPASLLARRAGVPDQPLVNTAGYLPSGPLSSLTLGNGLTETRTFNQRYFPSSITLAGTGDLLRWTYTTDAVGNILTVTDALSAANNRTYGYQDFHYFLTQGNGPWGPRAWAYDKIGNRLSESRGVTADTYSYVPSATGGRSPILSQVQQGAGGARAYQFGPAGHLESVTLGADSTLYRHDAAGRLSSLTKAGSGVAFRYDGRDYLTLADAEALPFAGGFESGDICAWSGAVGLAGIPSCPPPKPAVRPTYSSDGLLHALSRNVSPERSLVFFFAGRPVAQLDLAGGIQSWKYLTTDHLGTPIAATNPGGSLLWQGGLEPFGADWSGAGTAGVFLRFPGQWEEGSLASTGFRLYDNVNRYYEPSTGTYTKADPIGLEGGLNLYAYAFSSPLMHSDPLGLASFLCRRPLGDSKPKPGNTRIGPDIWGNPLYHQYACVVNGSVAHCGGHTADRLFKLGRPTRPDEGDLFDPSRCRKVQEDDRCIEQCITSKMKQPRPYYGVLGPFANCQEWAEDTISDCAFECSFSRCPNQLACALDHLF